MELKKNPRVDLYRMNNLFYAIGLCVSLLLVTIMIEWKTYNYSKLVDTPTQHDEFLEVYDVPHTEQPPPPPPKQTIIQPEIIAVADNEKVMADLDIQLDVEITEDMVINEQQAVDISGLTLDEPEKEESQEVFIIVEEQPEPMGGMEAFYAYVGENLEYPRRAILNRTVGKVFLQFIVERDGKIGNVKVLKGIGDGCDEEAVRVIKSAPAWKPGKQRGRPVRVRIIVPVAFKLNEPRI